MYSKKHIKKLKYVISNRPHLKLVITNPFNIPHRLYKYDKNIFIVWNTLTNRYEIHSLESNNPYNKKTTTYQFSWKKILDGKILKYLIYGDLKRNTKYFDKIHDDWNNYEEYQNKQLDDSITERKNALRNALYNHRQIY